MKDFKNGDSAIVYNVIAVIETVAQLPPISTTSVGDAYLLYEDPVYDLYVNNNELDWLIIENWCGVPEPKGDRKKNIHIKENENG